MWHKFLNPLKDFYDLRASTNENLPKLQFSFREEKEINLMYKKQKLCAL